MALAVRRLAAGVGVLAVIAAYTLAVGWPPSVVRAAVAGSLASLAWLAARPRDRWYYPACRRELPRQPVSTQRWRAGPRRRAPEGMGKHRALESIDNQVVWRPFVRTR